MTRTLSNPNTTSQAVAKTCFLVATWRPTQDHNRRGKRPPTQLQVPSVQANGGNRSPKPPAHPLLRRLISSNTRNNRTPVSILDAPSYKKTTLPNISTFNPSQTILWPSIPPTPAHPSYPPVAVPKWWPAHLTAAQHHGSISRRTHSSNTWVASMPRQDKGSLKRCCCKSDIMSAHPVAIL